MGYEPPTELSIEADGSVRIVTSNNPAQHNAFPVVLPEGLVGVRAHLANSSAGAALGLGGHRGNTCRRLPIYPLQPISFVSVYCSNPSSPFCRPMPLVL